MDICIEIARRTRQKWMQHEPKLNEDFKKREFYDFLIVQLGCESGA
jgi:hypothetical protein